MSTTLFLDSGAFSAYTKKKTIDVQGYISFIKRHKRKIAHYAVLDVIGDPIATLENQVIMEQAGLNPVPCFHFGEPWSFLREYVRNYNYIALGGLAQRRNSTELYPFLDHAFSLICDEHGMPQCKTHGFSITSVTVMTRYPWYSVDSVSWLIMSRMGLIYVPYKLPNGSWDYLEKQKGKKVRKIGVSDLKATVAVEDQHIQNVSQQWRNEVVEWVESHGEAMGLSKIKSVSIDYELEDNEQWLISPDQVTKERNCLYDGKKNKPCKVQVTLEKGVTTDFASRDRLNARFFMEVQNHFPKYPWKWIVPGLQPRLLT